MRFILKIAKKLIKLAVFILGLLVILRLIMNKLEEKGIIKREWIAQRTPAGRGLRYAMSVLDKFVISFQI